MSKFGEISRRIDEKFDCSRMIPSNVTRDIFRGDELGGDLWRYTCEREKKRRSSTRKIKTDDDSDGGAAVRSSNNASWIYIYRGKNSSLFSNWNNSILHARDLSFRDYASSSPRNIYIYIHVYTAIQVPTLAFLYYLGSFPRRKRYLSPLRGQCK